eukprot:CAMPEP_0170559438 /NCGR_PEP_ID=MMETSP0211-20121228/42697_1 /TAXON_ID=311385 /ORGANISM="Pseudokeronopsis sp., Strain OXSARD2" /LENGTH=104 /DNA_ID=CAMNT_0010872453 /DNA_START=202 /DNA_END=516 /DNA_ORIENTATION=-
MTNELAKEDSRLRRKDYHQLQQMGVSFNSSSPRFKSHDRMVKASLGPTPMVNIESLKSKEINVGPGSYHISNESRTFGFTGNMKGSFPFVASEKPNQTYVNDML